LIWRSRAERDVIELWRYTLREWGFDQAEKYTEAIVQAANWLSEQPESGSWQLYRGKTYRRWVVGRHAIIFRSDKRDLRIVRVLHVRQNISRDVS
jgi:toxin ParE1/3/4